MKKLYFLIVLVAVLSSSAKAEGVKQYFELNSGMNFGNFKVKSNNDNLGDIKNNLNGSIGYGLQFDRISLGLKAQINNFAGAVSNNYIINQEVKNIDIEIPPISEDKPILFIPAVSSESMTLNNTVTLKRTYSMFLTSNVELFKVWKLSTNLVGGVGVAIHEINEQDTIYINSAIYVANSYGMIGNLDKTTQETTKSSKIKYKASLAYTVGLQEWLNIKDNIAIGLGVNYTSLGSPEYSNNLKLDSKGSLGVDLGIRIYL